MLFYLNDNRIAEDHTFTASAAPDALVRFRFWTEQAHTGDIYFDNTKFAHVIPAYSPDLSDTEGRLVFSDSTVAEYKSAGKIDYWIAGGAGAPEIVDGAPYGVDSKVLSFDSQAGSTDQLFLNTSAASCNLIAFEADLMFIPDGSNSTYEFTLRSGSQAHLVQISAGTNGTVSIMDGTTTVASVATEEWFRLRWEYELLTSGSYEVRLYVNEKLVSTSTPNKSSVDPSEIYRVIVQANSTADGYAYFDNVKFEQK